MATKIARTTMTQRPKALLWPFFASLSTTASSSFEHLITVRYQRENCKSKTAAPLVTGNFSHKKSDPPAGEPEGRSAVRTEEKGKRAHGLGFRREGFEREERGGFTQETVRRKLWVCCQDPRGSDSLSRPPRSADDNNKAFSLPQ